MSILERGAADPLVAAAGPLGRRARLDEVVRLTAASVLWLSLLLVTYWWVADGGVRDLGGWASGLTSLGRLTGLVASVLLLAQVAADGAGAPAGGGLRAGPAGARCHRLVGFTSFNLMLAHIVADHLGVRRRRARPDARRRCGTWSPTTPGMLLATGGTVCLVMVVVTSIKAARRRIRYESWHLLHLYAYLGVGLALPHQLWTGQQFLSSTGPHRVLVDGVGASPPPPSSSGGSAFRCWRNLRHRLARHLGRPARRGGVASVYLTGRRLDRLGVEAGQFLSWRFLGRRGWTRANPYSLSAAPDGRSLRITVQAVGDGSAAAVQPAARHPGAGRGTVRTAQRPRPHPAQGRADRRRRRHHAAAGAGRGARLRCPVTPCSCSATPTEPLFARELDVLAPRRGLAGPAAPRAADAAPTPGSATASAPSTT